MNPLRLARTLRDDYLQLLRTTFSPRQQALKDAFNQEIEREGFLTREPFVSLAQPYQLVGPLINLTPETRRLFSLIAEEPYEHQAIATNRILNGESVVISTGTGSGKTEAFLMPIVDYCLQNREQPGLKAILIYPMNALATDQLRRVRTLLAGSGVTFGRYTGETEQYGSRSPDAPDEERVFRSEFRSNPPHLILTNYQMLEYMLLRGDGRDIFQGHNVRFVVLDEVHTYHGALGTDVASLLRRLRAALETGNAAPPLFIGTSATLRADEDGDDPREGIAGFFTKLTGQETTAEAVVMEVLDPPALPQDLALPTTPAINDEDLEAFDPEDNDLVLSLARKLAGLSADDEMTLSELWEQQRLPYLLLNWLRRPLPLSEMVTLLALEQGRDGEDPSVLGREIEAALLIGPHLPDSCSTKLRPRVHKFLRGLARFWRCTNPDCGRLMGEGISTCTVCGNRTLPLAICRTCGWDYFIGRESEGHILPWTEQSSTNQTTYLYDEPAVAIRVDQEDNPIEGDEENGDTATTDVDEIQERASEGQIFLCPSCLSFDDGSGEQGCTCDGDIPQRRMIVYNSRGTRCPVCNSRYGRYDVLSPVSLGNSSALANVARFVLRELPEANRKLLVFCDSRQDAAHQARFIEGIEEHLRLRRAVFHQLQDNPGWHDFHWLTEEIYHSFVEQGFLPRTRSSDAIQREKDKIEGSLLSEFVYSANVRASLERLGLVTIGYAGLQDELQNDAFQNICSEHRINTETAKTAVMRLLNLIRSGYAVNHEAFRTRLYRNDRLSRRYGLIPGRQVGMPLAFQRPGVRAENTNSFKLRSTWSDAGATAGVQAMWQRILGPDADIASLEAILDWLVEEDWLSWSRIGRNADEAEGYQVNWDTVEFAIPETLCRCMVCSRVSANDSEGNPCPRPGCDGSLGLWNGPIAEGNLNALLISAEVTPPMRPAEHSAAVDDETRAEVEKGFQTDPPKYNILVCTPTLELGVNIGDLEGVAMRNIPPSPANYAQRAGRTGRTSRMGFSVGFARNTPHDGYFFDHPDEVIAGAIPPPRFNLSNAPAVARHIHSLVLQEAEIEYPSDMSTFISDVGAVNDVTLQSLLQRISVALERATQLAKDVFGSLLVEAVPGWEAWLEDRASEVPQLIADAVETRALLVEGAVQRMQELGSRVVQTQSQRDAEQGYRNLARKLRENYRYAYLPRVLAEMGVLPGYAFPGDPGSLSLGYDPEPLFTGRLQAQREYAPHQIVYARTHRWRVTGVAMNRPGSFSRTRGAEQFEFTECNTCGLAGPAAGANNCVRCGAELGGATTTAWDVGAFQAVLAEVEPETEEERQFGRFDVRVHPQRDVGGRAFTLGPWRFELRQQEEIWWINHGPLRAVAEGQQDLPAGFRLCQQCGELRPEPEQPATGRGTRRRRDRRADRDEHDTRCGGEAVTVAIGHQDKADTLRLAAPGLNGLGTEGVSWAWSLAWSIIRGAVRLFDIDENDIEPRVLTRRNEGREEVEEILWVDSSLGGSGMLAEMMARMPEVARAACEHLEGHDCPRACYRCLKSYRNQRIHNLLDWRLVLPQLRVISVEEVVAGGDAFSSAAVTDGPEWVEARREGCGSPLELRLLRAMREHGLPEPEKQYSVVSDSGREITIADFAYPDQRVLIYADGLAFHSSLSRRIHDTRQSNDLQNMGYRVLRFVGPQIFRRPEDCVRQIEEALDT